MLFLQQRANPSKFFAAVTSHFNIPLSYTSCNLWSVWNCGNLQMIERGDMQENFIPFVGSCITFQELLLKRVPGLM